MQSHITYIKNLHVININISTYDMVDFLPDKKTVSFKKHQNA